MGFEPANLISQWVRSVRLHDVTRTTRGGRCVWVKRRRRGTDGVIGAGSALMRMANGGIRMFGSVSRWQAWELASFRLVNDGKPYRCGASGPRGIWMDDLPGHSLREHASNGSLTLPMLRAAGGELRRAHGLQCRLTRRPWSHGDPHLGNVLYDPASHRARLIDFETQHEPSRPADWRHADDLLTFLLELICRIPNDAWPGAIDSFLGGYGDEKVTAALYLRLRRVEWAEFLLWLARSPGSNAAQLRRALPIVLDLVGRSRG